MKIATWNLNWPRKGSARVEGILQEIKRVDADIFVLTETNDDVIHPPGYQPLSSDTLPEPRPYAFQEGDHEVTIWSRHPIVKVGINERYTSVCVQMQWSELKIYGTVIGILGVKKNFPSEVQNQIADWVALSSQGGNICFAGDFNVCWNGKGFPKVGRTEIATCFDNLGIRNLTRDIEGNIDHIAISECFTTVDDGSWNLDKKLSDHIGVWVNI